MLRKVILKGGFDNGKNYGKLEEFVQDHVGLQMPVGTKMTDEETRKLTLRLYCWCQDKKGRNAPIIREYDVYEFADNYGDVRWTV